MSDLDDERIKKYLGNMEERINFAKENGCKLLDCKVIDNNIELRLENIKLRKIAEKLAEELSKHIWLNDKDAILKIYREKVEEDETHS